MDELARLFPYTKALCAETTAERPPTPPTSTTPSQPSASHGALQPVTPSAPAPTATEEAPEASASQRSSSAAPAGPLTASAGAGVTGDWTRLETGRDETGDQSRSSCNPAGDAGGGVATEAHVLAATEVPEQEASKSVGEDAVAGKRTAATQQAEPPRPDSASASAHSPPDLALTGAIAGPVCAMRMASVRQPRQHCQSVGSKRSRAVQRVAADHLLPVAN